MLLLNFGKWKMDYNFLLILKWFKLSERFNCEVKDSKSVEKWLIL